MTNEKNDTLNINGGYPLHTFEDVESVYRNYISSLEDINKIREAYNFIVDKHKDQNRRSGEPYYHHLVEVAYIVSSLQGGPTTIIASFLHDVVEDTDVTIEEIEKLFGSEVAKIVNALTKIQRLKLSRINKEDFEAEDHRKIFIGMAKDIRVIIIKLADRLHNLRTLQALSSERQQAISQETLDVFVPIAHRLGLDLIKSEMENLCLKYLKPTIYKEINGLLSKKAKTMTKSLDSLKKRIADVLFENNIPFDISSRVKTIYSIYTKMYVKGHPFDEIYDILALRIITDTEIRCYEILGLIHKMYKPVPGRFKDYIAMPKPNMYQSLHTTIVSGNGNFYEIQIRTKEMDGIAETGVASHWAYKENTGYNSKKEQQEIEDKLHWFRDFVSVTNENSDADASDYVNNLSRDIFEANVYVFTPRGKVIELPNGSTPVDFAYRIHTKVGDSTTGAIVNGVMVPLNSILKTGDLIEIKTSKNSPGPSEGWLNFVRSAQAKACIRKFIAKKNADVLREEKIAKGRQSCIDAFKDRNIDEPEMMEFLDNSKVLNYFNFSSVEDLFIGVCGRKPIPSAIIDFLRIKRPISQPKTVSSSDYSICPVYCRGGGSRLAINLANCCTPIPGDEIIGYITKGKGISVHRKDCPNIANENERLINVYWRNDLPHTTYPVNVIIEANDRPNLLIDILNSLSVAKVNTSSVHATTNSNFVVTITATLHIGDLKKLNNIFNIMQNIPGIFSITRLIH